MKYIVSNMKYKKLLVQHEKVYDHNVTTYELQ